MEETVATPMAFSCTLEMSSILPECNDRFGVYSDFNDALVVMLALLDFISEGWGALVPEFLAEGNKFIYKYFAVEQEGAPEVICFAFTKIGIEGASAALETAFCYD